VGEKILEALSISKKFGGVIALENVNFYVNKGEIVALLGDNGAGKSTLIKIISGAIKPDGGEIFLDGKKVEIKNPIDSLNLGIETIYQNLALFNNLSAADNLFMGRELIKSGIGKYFSWLNKKEMENKTKNILKKFGIELQKMNNPVEKLSGGQRQSIALSRSVLWGKKLVIMDEPTAALGVKESSKLLDLIKNLINMVQGIVIISHNIEHVINIADRAVILRHGKNIGSIKINTFESDVCHKEIVSMITGVSLI
jgi:ABC-type sugar transport system ATPase subunit